MKGSTCMTLISFICAVLFTSSVAIASLSSLGSILAATTPYLAPYWMFLGSGLLVYILTILYLLTGKSLLGLAVSFHVHTYIYIATCNVLQNTC